MRLVFIVVVVVLFCIVLGFLKLPRGKGPKGKRL